MKKFADLEKSYKDNQLKWKTSIRLETNRFKRFWRWVWFLLAYPFVWIWVNIRDWRTALIFAITVAIVSCEVWVPYLIAFICWKNEAIRYSMLGVASACWLFWLGPGTPFLPLCIGITIGTKALINKITENKNVKTSKKVQRVLQTSETTMEDN